eukprot:CAMPEP_0171296294 /NCGR_PEP_ID=MMETSP0816-20121228/4960_1 /TAXON_ID=420281 /ORGANISM="Proboscia inermis, Strain CCAP1064/1" /LENGTH=125 /DNA_ID=CAMNT_0011769627 /DNA_START=424 /DNA_END=798 /DNA_ORIENTATION=-
MNPTEELGKSGGAHNNEFNRISSIKSGAFDDEFYSSRKSRRGKKEGVKGKDPKKVAAMGFINHDAYEKGGRQRRRYDGGNHYDNLDVDERSNTFGETDKSGFNNRDDNDNDSTNNSTLETNSNCW